MGRKAVFVILKIVLVVAILSGILWLSYKGYQKFLEILPSFQKADIHLLYEGIGEDYTYTLLEDEVLDLPHAPKIVEGKIYLPVDLIIDRLNPNFYWDGGEKILTYTTYDDVIRMKTDDLTYFVNDEPLTLNLPILVLEDAMAYVPVDILSKFSDYQMTYNSALDLLMIDDKSLDASFTTVSKKEAFLRVQEDEKSNYIKKLYQTDVLKIYGESSAWYYVRTQEGYLGYVQKNAVESSYLVPGTREEAYTEPFNDKKNFNGKINMVWHQVTNVTANGYLQDAMAGVTGLDVLSPTWFALSDSEGSISNLADLDYVAWAHAQGYQIWALFSNGFNAQMTHDVLNSTEKREKVIKQILAFVAIYGLDGINIDFENVASEDGPAYVQFMKELGPYLKNSGAIVSVDMYVPTAWTAHYNRAEVSKAVDYVIIMAYDEHWSTSPESGSVASINFVNDGILNTLKEVPKEKTILGLPYYTRVWAETQENGETVVSSKAYGMEGANTILTENEAPITWDDTVKQYYGQYSKEGAIYKVWLEEERSIEEKLKLMESYDVAGIAGWKLGLEKEAIWNVLNTYLKK